MNFRLSLAVFALVVAVAAQNPSQPAASQKRSITDRDLFDFIWVTNPQVSPDGTRVVFTRVNDDDSAPVTRPPSGWSLPLSKTHRFG